MGFSRQEYWSGLPWPPPGNLPDPEMEPVSLALQEDSLALSNLFGTASNNKNISAYNIAFFLLLFSSFLKPHVLHLPLILKI